MDYFKLYAQQLEQVNHMNEMWLTHYKKENSADSVTQFYAQAKEKDGYYYLLRDNVTNIYITEYVAIVSADEYITINQLTEYNNTEYIEETI